MFSLYFHFLMLVVVAIKEFKNHDQLSVDRCREILVWYCGRLCLFVATERSVAHKYREVEGYYLGNRHWRQEVFLLVGVRIRWVRFSGMILLLFFGVLMIRLWLRTKKNPWKLRAISTVSCRCVGWMPPSTSLFCFSCWMAFITSTPIGLFTGKFIPILLVYLHVAISNLQIFLS